MRNWVLSCWHRRWSHISPSCAHIGVTCWLLVGTWVRPQAEVAQLHAELLICLCRGHKVLLFLFGAIPCLQPHALCQLCARSVPGRPAISACWGELLSAVALTLRPKFAVKPNGYAYPHF